MQDREWIFEVDFISLFFKDNGKPYPNLCGELKCRLCDEHNGNFDPNNYSSMFCNGKKRGGFLICPNCIFEEDSKLPSKEYIYQIENEDFDIQYPPHLKTSCERNDWLNENLPSIVEAMKPRRFQHLFIYSFAEITSHRFLDEFSIACPQSVWSFSKWSSEASKIVSNIGTEVKQNFLSAMHVENINDIEGDLVIEVGCEQCHNRWFMGTYTSS